MSRGTWDTSRVLQDFVYEAFTLFGVSFQILLLPIRNPTSRSRNLPPFWLAPKERDLGFSLFARRYWGNLGDFFSSGYLDVSIPLVLLLLPYFEFQAKDITV